LIYLSNFSTAGKNEKAISIAALPPKWFTGESRKDLAPTVSILRETRNGKKSQFEYILEYLEIVYSLDLDILSKELDNHILLCFCPKNIFCHRFVLGSILQTETDVEVEEFDGFSDRWKDDFGSKIKPLHLILTEEEKNQYDLYSKFENDDIVGHWAELSKIGATHLFTDKISKTQKENINPNLLNMKGFTWDKKKLIWTKKCL